VAFHNTQFPADVSYGSRGGPGWRTLYSEDVNAVQQRIKTRDRAVRVFDVAYGIKSWAQLANVLEFYMAREGGGNGFRYKDWSDYHSGEGHWRSVTGIGDQNIGTGTGSLTQFQLRKAYTSGANTHWRTIELPVHTDEEGVVRKVSVWVNGVASVEDTNYTVNYTTGLVTFTVAPTSGHAITASFQFDVPAAFDPETDERLDLSQDAFDAGSLSCRIRELVTAGVMHTDELYHGGAWDGTFSANITLSTGVATLWNMSPTTTGLTVFLPNPDSPVLPRGRGLFSINNAGANTFTLKSHTGATLSSMTASKMVDVHLSEDAATVGVWIVV